jgi:DNA-binding winged helix-turn-helix (wHTH) protein
MKIYKFRNCFLNTLERRVIRDGKYLELTPRTFDVLQLLVEKSGKIVSKDEILGTIWNGNYVEEGNLAVHISKIRSMLSEGMSCRFVETVHGTGYRLVAPVLTGVPEEWDAAIFKQEIAVSAETGLPSERIDFGQEIILTGEIGDPPNQICVKVELTRKSNT